MKFISAFMPGFAILALSAGVASAATAGWTTATVAAVQVRSAWTVSGTTATEGNPVLYIALSTGPVFVRNIPSPMTEKASQMIEMAKQAAASGKRLSIFADPDRRASAQFCIDYGPSGCIQTSGLLSFPMIEDMAIVP